MKKIPAPYKRYNGGKSGSGTFQQIINFIPVITKYIEPFAGNAGIMRHLLLPGHVIINDLDTDVYEAWLQVFRNHKFPPQQIVEVYNKNGCSLIREHGQEDKSTFIYCDPPYTFETRKNKQSLYKQEWQKQDHEIFLHDVLQCKCSVMISHPKDAMYQDALKKWHTHDFQSMTSGGLMWDRIWMNYPAPVIRQDYRYLGSDYRERENIKRKIKSWVGKLRKIDEVQRIALLSAMIKEQPHTSASLVSRVMDPNGKNTVISSPLKTAI